MDASEQYVDNLSGTVPINFLTSLICKHEDFFGVNRLSLHYKSRNCPCPKLIEFKKVEERTYRNAEGALLLEIPLPAGLRMLKYSQSHLKGISLFPHS